MGASETYRRINDLRQATHDLYVAEQSARNDGYGTSIQPATLSPLGPDDWTADPAFGRTLGNPEIDYCVSIDANDAVLVFAAGDIAATATIPGASAL